MPKKKAAKAKRIDGLQPVMIDLDVHKAIEAARASFEETPNAILRRLLGIGRADATAARSKSVPTEPASADLKQPANSKEAPGLPSPSLEDAPALPDGSEIRADFYGVEVIGIVRDGAWKVDGSGFSLPTAALVASLTGAADPPPELEGWRDWEVRLPGSNAWRPLVDLAQRDAA